MTIEMARRGDGPDSRAWDGVVITASADDLAIIPTRGLYIGGTGGDITVTMASGRSATYTGIPAGSWCPLAIRKLTATTATNVVALY
jgi:hypothetical protein